MHRYGYRTASFAGQPAEETAVQLKELGFDCLELCLEAPDVRPEQLTERRCQELRAAMDRVGIGLASASYHGDREPLDVRRENQARAIQAARWLGTDVVILNAEKAVEPDRQRAELVEQLKRLCEPASQAGVVLAFEPEPLLVIGSSDDMLEMLHAVNCPNLAVNFDLGHAQVTDLDPAASVRMLGAGIVHLHLEDIRERVHKHLPFGEGDIDFSAVRQALSDIGYDGPYVADFFGQDNPLGVASRALAGMKERFG